MPLLLGKQLNTTYYELTSTRNVWLNGLVDGSLAAYTTLQLTELIVLAKDNHDVVTHLGWSPRGGDIGKLIALGNGKLMLGVTLTNLNTVSYTCLRLLDIGESGSGSS